MDIIRDVKSCVNSKPRRMLLNNQVRNGKSVMGFCGLGTVLRGEIMNIKKIEKILCGFCIVCLFALKSVCDRVYYQNIARSAHCSARGNTARRGKKFKWRGNSSVFRNSSNPPLFVLWPIFAPYISS